MLLGVYCDSMKLFKNDELFNVGMNMVSMYILRDCEIFNISGKVITFDKRAAYILLYSLMKHLLYGLKVLKNEIPPE